MIEFQGKARLVSIKILPKESETWSHTALKELGELKKEKHKAIMLLCAKSKIW